MRRRHMKVPIVLGIRVLLPLLICLTVNVTSYANVSPLDPIISIDVNSMDAKLVISEMASMAGVNIIIDDTITARVSAKLTGVPFDVALEAIARMIGASVSSESGMYSVTNTRGVYYPQQAMQEQSSIQILDFSAIGMEMGLKLVKAVSTDLSIEELPELNSVILSGPYGKVQAVKAAVDNYVRGSGAGSIQDNAFSMMKLAYADSSELAMALQGQYMNTRITSIRTDNALLISGPSDKIGAIVELVGRMDKKPAQFRVEVEIIEAASEDLDAYGVDWANAYGGTTISIAFRELDRAYDPTQSMLENLLGIRPMTRSSLQLSLYARALVAEGRANVLARPSITVLENRTARVTTGDRDSLTMEQNGSSWQQTAYVDSGISLEITARLDPEGNIVAILSPRANSIVGFTTNGSPIIGTREVKTIVRLKDGETTTIGGLIREDVTESLSGLPILSEIPIIGKLFSTTRKQEKKSELIMLITISIL